MLPPPEIESSGCAFSLADANDVSLLLSTTFERNKELQVVMVRIQEGSIIRETITAETPDEQAQKLVVLFTKVHEDMFMFALKTFVTIKVLMMYVCGNPETNRAPPEPTDVQSLKEDKCKVT